jgi:UDP-N-acetylmuramate: L-alanyl-gamma-D-glutamyl-meso-diaminopimelate ligase
LPWDAGLVVSALRGQGEAMATVDALIERLGQLAQPGDHIVFMSNGGFENAPRRMLARLK